MLKSVNFPIAFGAVMRFLGRDEWGRDLYVIYAKCPNNVFFIKFFGPDPRKVHTTALYLQNVDCNWPS